MAYYGDCAEAPYPTAHATLLAAPGTEISYRWVVDGKPQDTFTRKIGDGGFLQAQAFHWHRNPKTDGVVRFEVLNHNKPSMEAAYPIHCQS